MPEAPSKPLHCPGCGRKHKEEGRFCPLCGRDLKAFMQPSRGGDPMIGQIIDQRYRIIKPVGRGGMGVVYHVEHIAMGKVMAMKLVHPHVRSRPHSVKRFRQEIKVVSRLQHVHTVSVFDCGDAEDGSLYIVMEYLRGLDLEKLLQHEEHLSCERTARIARQVCASLSDAHKHGIIHRDIKPANIFLLRDGAEYDFVKVLDFGIAKLIAPGQEKVTEIGLIVGTPFYMAPEQARGSSGLSPTTDIYSLGVVMYEMITGQLPFKGKTVADFIEAHLRKEPPPPSEATQEYIDPELEGIILRAMSKDPSARFPTIDAMQIALDTYLERQVQMKVRASSASFPNEYISSAPPHASNELHVDPASNRYTEHFKRDSHSHLLASPSDSARTTVEPSVPVVPFPVDSEEFPPELVASRADWDRVERSWKRKRRARRVFPTLLLFVLLGVGGYYGWTYKSVWLPGLTTPSKKRVYQKEHEPNNHITHATTIPTGKVIPGHFGAAQEGRPSDYDWYRVAFPEGQKIRISVEIKPPSFANVELGLYRMQRVQKGNNTLLRPREIRTTDNALRGGIERIPSYLWEGGDLYILVRELIIPGESPQKGPYQLHVRVLSADPSYEQEPNEGFQQASILRIGQTIQAFHDVKDDVDYFQMSVPNKGKRKAFCKLRIHQAEREHAPQWALLSAQGQSIRPRRIQRFTFYEKKRRGQRGKKRKRIRRRAILVTFRASGKIFLRVRTTHPNTLQTYSASFTCK